MFKDMFIVFLQIPALEGYQPGKVRRLGFGAIDSDVADAATIDRFIAVIDQTEQNSISVATAILGIRGIGSAENHDWQDQYAFSGLVFFFQVFNFAF
ncbi:hypothetical protein RSP799_20670 [Ralstonia solanacearum]|nr:hypothetical protein RSP799_20670 [Ralstonia solanacearum]